MSKILFFDTETGGVGIDAARTWSLVQLGAVVYDTESDFDAVPEPSFECVINEELADWKLSLHPEALKVNGFTEERIRTEGISPSTAALNFLRFCWKNIPGSIDGELITLGAHAVGYDTHFLYRLFRAAGCPEVYDKTFNYRTVDTAATARFLIDAGILPLAKPTSETLFEFFGCKPDKAHDALSDTKATVTLYKKMRRLVQDYPHPSLDDVFVCKLPGYPSEFPGLRKRY